MDNEDAARQLAIPFQIPGHPKRLQWQREVDAITCDCLPKIHGSQGYNEFLQSYICQPSHEAILEVKANNWYSSGVFQETNKLLANGCPQLEQEFNYEAMGPIRYRELVMPLSYCPAMDDRNDAN
jgi:hypothetical protein